MARIVRAGLIQCSNVIPPTPEDKIKSQEQAIKEVKKIAAAMLKKQINLTKKAAKKGVKILCYQELFNGPYFCAEHNMRWYALAELVTGPTIKTMQKLANQLKIILCVPFYEKTITGVYYNSAVLIDEKGKIIGHYRKNHIPHVHPGFYEKYYFKPGNLGYPVFDTSIGKVGIYICYDRHFPEGARCLGLNGAEIIFNPSATIAGVSKYLWELEQPAHAVANGYFVGAINRVGLEEPWKWGEFYGSSYFCNPKGEIIAQASENKDEIVVADLNFDQIREIRNAWQFYRDRRPETYTAIGQLLP